MVAKLALVTAALLSGALGLGACPGRRDPAPMEVLSWPGQDGRQVALDQRLVLEFDQELDPFLRPGAFELRRTGARRAIPIEYEVSGRLLILTPELPRQPDLSDGTLEAGAEYELVLHGVPRLVCFTSREGGALVGSREVFFQTASLEDPGALGGDAVAGPLRLDLPSAPHPHVPVGPNGWILIDFDAGIDPRSLRKPARLWLGGSEEAREVALELQENQLALARVRAYVGGLGGIAVLELPALESLGGRPLLESARRIRLVPGR